VAEALNLKAGGSVDIIVSPVKKSMFEVTLKPTPVELSQSSKEV
jgi:hypothetical protein